MDFIKCWEGVYARFLAENATACKLVIEVLFALFVLAILGYVPILIVYCTGRVHRRQVERMEIERRLRYGLPEGENSYLRSRLHTVLRDEEMGSEGLTGGVPVEDSLRLTHAKALLCKLRESALSPADRLQTEELSKTLGLYVEKNRYQTNDIRLLNDTLSALLKLSAKYGI